MYVSYILFNPLSADYSFSYIFSIFNIGRCGFGELSCDVGYRIKRELDGIFFTSFSFLAPT